MGTFILSDAEKRLFKGVEHGDSVEFGPNEEIRSEILRHIIIGLPLIRKGRVRSAASAVLGGSPREIRCRVTGVGISLKGGVIRERLRLDGAIGEQAEPISPLLFEGTHFEGGFSGRHAHFSHLGFRGCRFRDRPDDAAWPPTPTIDLTGAQFDNGLVLRDIGPEGNDDHLWIRAPDSRIAGPLDLSCSHLRAPRDDKARRLISEPPVAALDLTRAEIAGDLRMMTGFQSQGRIYCPGMRVQGDLRMSGAIITVEEEEGLKLRTARIDGMAVLSDRPNADEGDSNRRPFVCNGDIDLRAAEIGDDLHIQTEMLGGKLDCLDLTVGNDVLLYARVHGQVDLSGCRIGGTLDLSRLQIDREEEILRIEPESLLLCGGTIQRALRLVRDDFKEGGAIPRSEFEMNGMADLGGLSCETLEDDLGRLWKGADVIRMHNFIYRRTGSLPENQRKPQSNRIFGDWVLRNRADGNRPWRWFPGKLPPPEEDFRETWQVRRDWIYRQFDSDETKAARDDRGLSNSRHEIDEVDYHPQPFEQAIRVARAEGREGFATQFEMLKQRIEWRFFNQRVRWGLSVVGLLLAGLWLIVKVESIEWRIWTAITFAVTAIAMINTSKIHNFYRGLLAIADKRKDRDDGQPHPPHPVRRFTARVLTWVTYFFAPAILFIHGWREEPFYFLIALLIYGIVRLLGVFAHAVMRFGFGYMRRPINAICTLIAAFLLGWWGVDFANEEGMLVVDAEPVAALAGPEAPGSRQAPVFMGSLRATEGASLIRDIPCGHLISEPLYALDILIPLLDLREESRCEVRRTAERGNEPPEAAQMRGLGGVIQAVPALTVRNNGFWAVMKVLYAIAGWFIVSLSILTFAQSTRTHAEPPMEKG